MKTLILLIAAASLSFGQAFTYETTTTKATVLVPAGSNKTVSFTSPAAGVTIYCSTASSATLSRDGTAPTTTEGIPVALNPLDTISGSDVKVYTASNVGSGTHIKTYTIAAGDERVIDLSNFGLTKGKSVTIATDNSCRIFFLGVIR